MIDLAAVALALALHQDPDPAPAGDPAPQAEVPSAPAAPVGPARPKGADEVRNALSKLGAMSAADRTAALARLTQQYGGADTNSVLPTADIDLDRYLALEPAQQVEVVARGFLSDLIGGETSRLVRRAGYPFFIESKRIDKPEELTEAWARTIRTRRTDLLALYSVEALTPAEMEKKYGKAPARLNGWNPRSGQSYFAVANLSGHAAVLLLRQAGAAWQVVGFSD